MDEENKRLRIFTVGWEPNVIKVLIAPIMERTGFDFIHGMVGDASRIEHVEKQFPQMSFLSLVKTAKEALPEPDYDLLASLECVGVPTLRSMVQGDSVLRNRSETEALGYATLLARNIQKAFNKYQPDVVLGSYDSLHAAISLAVAKSLNIPWVAMAFTVIPDNLTGFCYGLTPNTLLPMMRPVDENLKKEARTLIDNVNAKKQNTMAYKAPASLRDWLRQYIFHSKSLIRRKQDKKILGVDSYIYPSIRERVYDIFRRSLNRFQLPVSDMISSPPKGRFIYYPMHMAPESMLDTWAPFYQDQLAFIKQLSHSVPIDVTIVVKLHFSDPDNYSCQALKNLKMIPNLEIAHPDSSGDKFIEDASLVIGIQGTSCLQASLRGKPVLLFGDSPYVNFPGAERAVKPDGVYQQISRMLMSEEPLGEEIVEAYAHYMARYMPGRINDWSYPVNAEEVERYVECFERLREFILDSNYASNWYEPHQFTDGFFVHQSSGEK